MARREIILEVGGRKYALRFSCAAAAIIDPEDALSLREFAEGALKVPFLKRAVLAALEGARLFHEPTAAAYTERDAEAIVDGLGVLPASKAVCEVYAEWRVPADLTTPEGRGDPKA